MSRRKSENASRYAKPVSAVLVGPEVGSAKQPRIELAGAEVGLRDEGLSHAWRASIREKCSSRGGESCWLSTSLASFSSSSASRARRSARAEFSVKGKQNSDARRLTNALLKYGGKSPSLGRKM